MYYPLSQIRTNLHTNGNELVYKSSKAPYSGYYWENSRGQYFTGKTPQDTPTEELISYTNIAENNTTVSDNAVAYYNQNEVDSINYLNLTKPPAPPIPPQYAITFPTQQDYQIGEFRRYFCKKTNEISYLEINNDTYAKLVDQDPSILYQYYTPFLIPWRLTGDINYVYITNKNITELTMKQQKLSMFDLYLKKDYIKYYK